MKYLLTLLLSIFAGSLSAQQYIISGYVEDASTGERVVGAYIYDSVSNNWIITNDYGFFSLKDCSEKALLSISYIGYMPFVREIDLHKDTIVTLKIATNNVIDEVIVRSDIYKRTVNTSLSLSIIPVKSLISIPALGEVDLLKSLQNQPGVKGGIEGSSGLNVRGSSDGDNLIMLDDVPLYNVSHLFGFFSSFNSSVIKDIKLIKGCFPARYGGRSASVIDVRCRDGNNKKFTGEASLGIISSKLTIEGPLLHDKTTYILTARRSYFDLYSDLLKRRGIMKESLPGYYFYDLNGRITHTFSQKDRIHLNFYNGKDNMQNKNTDIEESDDNEKFTEIRKDNTGWTNTLGSVRWNHTFNNKLFLNTTFAASKYEYYTEDDYNSTREIFDTEEKIDRIYWFTYNAGLQDINLKADFDYFGINNHRIKLGTGNIFHNIDPGKSNYYIEDSETGEYSDTTFTNDNIDAQTRSLYIEDEFILIENLTINAGLRITDFKTGKSIYTNAEPRLALNWLLTGNIAVKGGYSRMVQYIQLISENNVTMPLDLWVPSAKGLEPLKSDQATLGFSYNYKNDIVFTIEGYYKELINTTDYIEGASLAGEQVPWYERVTQGKGTAKGIEISAERQSGKLLAGIYYTISKSDRTYKELNTNSTFPFKYDRLHDITISTNYQISDKWDISFLWVYYSGNPITLETEKYLPAISVYSGTSDFGHEIHYFPNKNNFRLPAYHRLDIGIHRTTKNKLGKQTISFDIFNAYNRKNPVQANYSDVRFKKILYSHLLPIIPTISYTIKFE